MNCEHLEITRERMKSGPHYEKILCRACGTFLGWGKNPATIQREKDNAEKIARLRNLGGKAFTAVEKEFLGKVAKGEKISPKQQAWFERIYSEKFL